MDQEFGKRDFFKLGVTVGAGLIVSGKSLYVSSTRTQPPQIQVLPIDPVRIGFVGVGWQESSHVKNFLNIEGVEIRVNLLQIPVVAKNSCLNITVVNKHAINGILPLYSCNGDLPGSVFRCAITS